MAYILIRSYDPLSIHFPAPQVYEGLVKLVIPPPDHPFLAAYRDPGPTVIEINLSKKTTAQEIWDIIFDNMEEFKPATSGIASSLTFTNRLRRHLELKDKRFKKGKEVEDLSVSVELLEDEEEAYEFGPWDEETTASNPD